jgi:hypothetical protein
VFTRRHEQEIAEIKELTHELGARLEEILKQLERIKEAQDQLAGERPAPGRPVASARSSQAVGDRAAGRAAAAAKAQRKAARSKAATGGQQGSNDAAAGKDRKASKRRRTARPASSPAAKDR